MSAAGRPGRVVVVVGRDAADTQENRAFAALARALVEVADARVSVLLQHGGPLVDDLAAVAPTIVADGLARRSPAAVVERLLGRVGLRAGAARVRGHRLGLARLTAADAVYLHTVLSVQVLRYLPAGVPVLCRVPESAHPLRQPLSAPDLRLLLDRVTRLLPTTGAGLDELTGVHGVPPGRLTRVREAVVPPPAPPSAAEVDALRRDLGLTPDDVVAGVFGAAAVEIHAPAVPLAVAVRRRPQGERVALLLVVPEHMTDPWARHDIDRAGLADRVALLELEPPAPPAVALCDVVVHAGWGSDQPLAYLEAAAAGVPVVCAEGHELAEVVGDDEGGYVCPRLDLPAMAEAVVALAVDPEQRRSKGARAAARVAAAHAPAAAAARLWDEIREVWR